MTQFTSTLMKSSVSVHVKEQWENQNGNFHREDGPAITLNSGKEYWYCDGLLHNGKGPSHLSKAGNPVYTLHGMPLPFTSWLKCCDLPETQKTLMRLKYESAHHNNA